MTLKEAARALIAAKEHKDKALDELQAASGEYADAERKYLDAVKSGDHRCLIGKTMIVVTLGVIHVFTADDENFLDAGEEEG